MFITLLSSLILLPQQRKSSNLKLTLSKTCSSQSHRQSTSSSGKMAETKFNFGFALVRPNGPNTNSQTTRSKLITALPSFPAKNCTYSTKRKNVITSSMNGKNSSCPILKEANASSTIKTKIKMLLNRHMPRVVHSFLLQASPTHFAPVSLA